MKMKPKTIRRILLTCIGVLLTYAFLVEPYWLQVTHHPIGSSDTRIRIVQISDLHMRNYGQREKSVIGELSRLKPDLVLFTGDVIDRPEAIPVLDDFLKATGDVPKLAVLGNWEYWGDVDIAALRTLYESRGSRLLVNESVRLVLRGKQVDIVGLDDYTAGNPATTSSLPLAGNSDLVILLQHSPGMFDDRTFIKNLNKLRLDLCLSGHTHAGQITMFGMPLWKPPGSGYFSAGWYATENCSLYVSRGIGTSVLPARLGARPEIAVFDL
jgi:predicted MPP superfamily phosphohydrolase